MAKCLFVAGTATDVGKTFISAQIVKCLRDNNFNAGYYKAAASGVELDDKGHLTGGDPIYVNDTANIGEQTENLVSYVYKEAVSPHLAAKINNNPIDFDIITHDFTRAKNKYDYLVVEGSGGVVCPLRFDDSKRIMLLDIVTAFNLPIVLVADAGLGTINAAVLTVEYLQRRNIKIKGIILNHFHDELMERDNLMMIETLTNIPVIAKVQRGDTSLNMDINNLIKIFE